MSAAYKLGWIRDREEHIQAQPRFDAIRASRMMGGSRTASLPRAFSGLRSHCYIRDQGGTSACVGFAFTGAIYARLHAIGLRPALFSPFSAYGVARQLDGARYPLPDEGSIPYLAIQGFSDFGVAPESAFPFNDNAVDVFKEVDFDAIMKASQFRVSSFSRFEGSIDAYREFVKRAAVAMHPTMIGMEVGRAFMNYRAGDSPVDVEPEDSLEGGHMVWICGYEDDGDTLLVPNSWGKSYGDNGFVRITLEKAYRQGSDFSELTIEKKAA